MKGSKRVERLLRKERAKRDNIGEKGQVAVGYIRVSTEEQSKSGYGLESQERAIRAFAESQGYTLLDVIADAAITGATQPRKRPGFGHVLEMAEEKSVAVLLVWKIDRLARSSVHAVTSANDLREQHGVVVRNVTEPIDTATPMGQTIFAILAGTRRDGKWHPGTVRYVLDNPATRSH